MTKKFKEIEDGHQKLFEDQRQLINRIKRKLLEARDSSTMAHCSFSAMYPPTPLKEGEPYPTLEELSKPIPFGEGFKAWNHGAPLPRTEEEVGTFIKHRTRLWRQSWITHVLEGILKDLDYEVCKCCEWSEIHYKTTRYFTCPKDCDCHKKIAR